ncbi:hypothetical protein BaRGS_00010023 [Batillaria attramentaria]|uniref:Large ribosomal subunit protein mL43 n=1 Tax=Batillaria attramentaria TaxID=370345 RepID=A0ABD0LHG4_9CAEN
MSNRAIPFNFVKNVMQNGVGRYMCQLQRVTLTFCKSSGASRGMRDFIEQHMLDFTKSNPGVVVYVKPRRHRAPALVAEYLNGRREVFSTNKMEADEICKWMEHLRTRSGEEIVRLAKPWHTETPSIQGIWHPFLNKDPSLAPTSFPAPDLYRAKKESKSATEILVEDTKESKSATEILVEDTLARKVADVDSISSKE